MIDIWIDKDDKFCEDVCQEDFINIMINNTIKNKNISWIKNIL
jgi:hypothetical protein